jgi:YHS domain-containing protein
MQTRSVRNLWFTVVVLVVVGCGPQEGAVGRVASDKVWRNAEGKAICPIMNIPVVDEKIAPMKVEQDGVTYYLCCDSCKAQYESDHGVISRSKK